jgi:hypothetical protein
VFLLQNIEPDCFSNKPRWPGSSIVKEEWDGCAAIPLAPIVARDRQSYRVFDWSGLVKKQYWWPIVAAVAIVVGINMCGDERPHTPSGARATVSAFDPGTQL